MNSDDLSSVTPLENASSGSHSRVLILGGGVAGAAAAIRMAQRGCAVTLYERATFPREKVCGCCLGAAGLSALDAIGCGDSVRALGMQTNRFVGFFQTGRSTLGDSDGTVSKNSLRCRSVELPIQPGVAISRSVLDSHLLETARAAGVIVQQPVEGRIDSTDATGCWVRHRRIEAREETATILWSESEHFDLVVVATGLTGRFQSGVNGADKSEHRLELTWNHPPHGPLGISTHLPADHELARRWPLAAGDIQMICDDDGYVGLVRLPGGSIDIAAALNRPRVRSGRPGKDVQSVSVSIRETLVDQVICMLLKVPEFADSDGSPKINSIVDPGHLADPGRRIQPGGLGFRDQLSHWMRNEAMIMTTPPLRRDRKIGQNRVVLIGDAASYVEPLTGEGMTWAIEGGLAVADLWWQTIHPLRADSGPNPRLDAKNGPVQLNFSDQWRQVAAGLHPKRRRICSWVTRLARRKWIRQLTTIVLPRFPWLAEPLIRGLAHGPTFELTAIEPRVAPSRSAS